MENLFLTTKDNTRIAINYYNKNRDEVVIIAPGWCMTKDSKAFLEIAQEFNKKYDVISLDFRGHGKSKGFYTFSAKEILDLSCVVDFAKKYQKIYLVGFSLGANICLIYAAQDKSISKVIAISPACDFNKIENQMHKKAAWGETIKKFELSRFLSIRPCVVPYKKIKPIDIIKKIEAPTLFVAGKKDPTVHFWHTEKLYQETICKKEFKIYKNGFHAEDLFLHYREDFTTTCYSWLSN